MSSSHPVVAHYDLDGFAAEGGERHQNRDGWGMVFSEGRDAHYFREATAASNSPLDRFVREHTSPHDYAIAHVRRASKGEKSLVNTHPFRRIVHGRLHHFAHNGTLEGLDNGWDAKRLVADRVGDTDSELAFLVLLDRLKRYITDSADSTSRFDVFRDFSADMSDFGPANFLWLDRDMLFVHSDKRVHETLDGLTEPRPPGLHMLHPSPGTLGARHECTGATLENPPDDIVIFASLPLSDEPWEALEQGTVIAVSAGRIVQREQAGKRV